MRRQYTCLQSYCTNPTSVIGPCKACRLKKCITAGMKIGSVLVRKSPTKLDQWKECTFAKNIITAHDGIFINKINVLTRLADQKNQILEMGIPKAGAERMEISRTSEFYSMLMYFQASGIQALGLDKSEMILLATKIFYRWLFFSEIIATLRHAGHQNGNVYLTDCTYIPFTYDDTYEFVQNQNLNNVSVLAKFYYELFKKGMTIANRFHNHQLDSIEVTLFLHLMIISQAKDLFPHNSALKTHLNELLKQTKKHQSENYSQMEIRFGNLLFMIYGIDEVEMDFRNLGILLILNGYKSIMPKLIADYKNGQLCST